MNSKKCILISQVWLTPGREAFRDMLEVSVEYCRILNPDSYIVLSGMGTSPTEKTIKACDAVCWNEDIVEPAGCGFPIMIGKGLQLAKEKGFEKVFKFRGDAVILQENVVSHCEEVLESEDKHLLITQETTRTHWVGDMVLYGDIEFLIEMFNTETWIPNVSGNDALARNYMNLTGYNGEDWTSFLKRRCSFRDIPFFKWTDLRDNYDYIKYFKDNLEYIRQNGTLNNEFNYSDFLYGKRRQVHLFDENHNPIVDRPMPHPTMMYERYFYK